MMLKSITGLVYILKCVDITIRVKRGWEEVGAASKPDTVAVSERPIPPDRVVLSSERPITKKNNCDVGYKEKPNNMRFYWNSLHVFCWVLLVVSLERGWPEWCMIVLFCAIMLWFPVKRQGASL